MKNYCQSIPGIIKKRVTYDFMLRWVFLMSFIKTVYPCPNEHYIIINSKGDPIDCFLCHNCPEGTGLSPPCGRKMTESEKETIACVPCEPGKTFSDQLGPSSCKRCNICSANELIKTHCSIYHNSQCSESCYEGYYFDNLTTHECQKCSYCCLDGKDSFVSACKDMPKYKQCSIHRHSECSKFSPRPPLISTNNNVPATTNSSSTLSERQILTGVAVGLAILTIIVIIIAIICNWMLANNQTTDQDQLVLITPYLSRRINLQLTTTPAIFKVQEGKNIKIESRIMQGGIDIDYNEIHIKWKKDGAVMTEFENKSTYQKENVSILDFGLYTCEVKYNIDETTYVKDVFLDVEPRNGKCYKKIRHLCEEHTFDEEKFIFLLAPKWEIIAKYCKMEDYKINYYKNDIRVTSWDAAKILFEIIQCSAKTVYDIIKCIKEGKHVKLQDLVEFLFEDVKNILEDEKIDGVAELQESDVSNATSRPRPSLQRSNSQYETGGI